MPTYEYKCDACEHHFDLRQSFDAATVTDCPECGKLAKRLFSLVPVIFKGSGWYVNDYSRKNSTLSEDHKEKESKESKESSAPSSPNGTSKDTSTDKAKDSKQESKPKEESKT